MQLIDRLGPDQGDKITLNYHGFRDINFAQLYAYDLNQRTVKKVTLYHVEDNFDN